MGTMTKEETARAIADLCGTLADFARLCRDGKAMLGAYHVRGAARVVANNPREDDARSIERVAEMLPAGTLEEIEVSRTRDRGATVSSINITAS